MEEDDNVGETKRTISRQEFMALDADAVSHFVITRFDVLRANGCDAETAVVLAACHEIDVDAALELVEAGCDSRTVLHILL